MLESFGECLHRWMRQRGYTNARLAQLTHQKSGTTVSRLLHDQCTVQRCAAFLEELMAAVPDMPPEEVAQFRQGLEVNRFGKDHFRAHQVFMELMTSAHGLMPASMTTAWDALADRITPWLAEGPCELLCFGCFDPQVLSTLGCLLRDPAGQLTVTHYFSQELHADLIFLLEHTLLMLGDPRYQLISIHSDARLQVSSIATQDALILRNSTGASRLILPVSGGEPLVQDFTPENDLFAFYQQALAADREHQHHYSSDFSHGSAMDYVAFLETCLSYEHNRSVYQIKPDIGLEYMPIPTVKANFEAWLSQHPEYAPVANGLVELCTRRHQNIYAKRHPHYLVLCKEAMTAFARTGRISDHPFCLRPFTPEERVEILNHLICQAEENACFRLLVLRDPAALPQHQLIAYDNLGLLICDTQTDYSLEGYSEIFLNSPLVAGQFKTFLLDVVGATLTETPAETIRFLRGLTELV